jgi:chromate transporter
MVETAEPTPWAGGRAVSLSELFKAYLTIGLLGFGGVGPITRHQLVERRGWLTDQEFVALLSLCKVLPGPNTINMAVITADRFQGLKGVAAALVALLGGPIALAVLLAEAYAHWSSEPLARAAMTGAAAGAAGLVMGTAAKMALALKRDWVSASSGLATLLATAVFSAPLVGVVGVVGPLATMAVAVRRRMGRNA